MLELVFIWFTVWTLMRLLKEQSAQTIVLIAGWVLALALVYGLPHLHGALAVDLVRSAFPEGAL